MCIQQIDTYNCGHSHSFFKRHPGATELCDITPKVFVHTDGDCGCSEADRCCPDCGGLQSVSSTDSKLTTKTPGPSSTVTYQRTPTPQLAQRREEVIYKQAPRTLFCPIYDFNAGRQPDNMSLKDFARRRQQDHDGKSREKKPNLRRTTTGSPDSEYLDPLNARIVSNLASIDEMYDFCTHGGRLPMKASNTPSASKSASKKEFKKPETLRHPSRLYRSYDSPYASATSPAPSSRSYIPWRERVEAQEDFHQAKFELTKKEKERNAAQKRFWEAKDKLITLDEEQQEIDLDFLSHTGGVSKGSCGPEKYFTDAEYEALRKEQDMQAAEVDDLSRQIKAMEGIY